MQCRHSLNVVGADNATIFKDASRTNCAKVGRIIEMIKSQKKEGLCFQLAILDSLKAWPVADCGCW